MPCLQLLDSPLRASIIIEQSWLPLQLDDDWDKCAVANDVIHHVSDVVTLQPHHALLDVDSVFALLDVSL